jgi:hypothetical protein
MLPCNLRTSGEVLMNFLIGSQHCKVMSVCLSVWDLLPVSKLLHIFSYIQYERLSLPQPPQKKQIKR